jgi:flagellar biosynthesis protein FliQ
VLQRNQNAMTPDFAINMCRKAVETILLVSAPMLLAGMIIGLLISIFQAATQINEQTLSFIPKIVAVFLTLLIFGPWIIRILTAFTIGIFDSMATF